MCKHSKAIRRHWSESNVATRRTGALWYPEARRLIFQMSMEYGRSVKVVAGVVAALSQRCQWSTNIDRAHHVLAGGGDPGGLGRAAAKALAILDGGDPVHVLGSRAFKVQAFYAALMGDDDVAVLDTWILRALGWTKAWYTRLDYEKLADVVAAEADHAGRYVAEYQAIVWCQVRGASE